MENVKKYNLFCFFFISKHPSHTHPPKLITDGIHVYVPWELTYFLVERFCVFRIDNKKILNNHFIYINIQFPYSMYNSNILLIKIIVILI